MAYWVRRRDDMVYFIRVPCLSSVPPSPMRCAPTSRKGQRRVSVYLSWNAFWRRCTEIMSCYRFFPKPEDGVVNPRRNRFRKSTVKSSGLEEKRNAGETLANLVGFRGFEVACHPFGIRIFAYTARLSDPVLSRRLDGGCGVGVMDVRSTSHIRQMSRVGWFPR